VFSSALRGSEKIHWLHYLHKIRHFYFETTAPKQLK
jgi:hypothetical protein